MPRAKLTESYIKSMPVPSGSLYELHWDTEVKGLTARITKGGSRHFVLAYTFDGKNKRFTIGRWMPPPSNRLGGPATREFVGTLDWARQEAKQLIGRIAAGHDPSQQKKDSRAAREAAKQQAAKEVTVATLADRYLKEWAKPNKRSWKEDERRIELVIKPTWGNRKAKEITRADVHQLIKPVAIGDPQNGIAPRLAEAGHRLALVRKMYSYALDEEIVEVHPCLRMKIPGGKPKPRTRALTTPKELRVLWRITDPESIWSRAPVKRRTAASLRDKRFAHGEGDALRLLLLTGARASEVCDLPWAELDLDAATWLLPAARSKNKRPNLIPLIPVAVDLLRRRRETVEGDHVFPAARSPHLVDENLSRPLREICKELQRAGFGGVLLGVDPFTPHDLRRTVETGMAAAKVPKEYRDRVLNHIDASVGGQHYNMYDYLDEKREALEKWWRRLEGMLQGEKSNVVPLRRAG
ncbi:tyrosine-type recombinase/integrase [Luteimonas sp. 50]|uniref:Tyrosine-type recombinase/integrase n=1 Tax=Cognatiluteimonas sedimenti TaxID=2927791 RepID=A0ABT0A1Y9_9GAMM|nr:site-specific integrase [Lysobacter sedimenti]MCJ0824983.1 tyrosine-type recombinase/integrase [Lysobacter sedimenti]